MFQSLEKNHVDPGNMAKDTRHWSPGAYYPYGNQSSWPPGDEEVDSQVSYTIGWQRAYSTSFDSGVGHCVGNGLQMTDGGAGPYPCDPSPGLHGPYPPAVGSVRTHLAHFPPQKTSGGPTESEPWDLLGQREGRINGSGLPGPWAYDVPQTDNEAL